MGAAGSRKMAEEFDKRIVVQETVHAINGGLTLT